MQTPSLKDRWYLVLALLTCLHGTGSGLASGQPAQADLDRVLSDSQFWQYGFPDLRSKKWWSRAMLDRAAVVNNYQQVRPVLDKLKAKQPITVVALGSSITSDLGGCFHTNISQVTERVRVPNHVYALADWGGNKCNPEGWLHWFMSYINQTWPHPGHLLINSGCPATNFHSFVEGTCLEFQLPDSADIVILEHNDQTGLGDDKAIFERLLWRLYDHFGSTNTGRGPAVIVYNTVKAVELGSIEDQCNREPEAKCHTLCAQQYRHLFNTSMFQASVEDHFHTVAQYYGLASLSFRNFMFSVFRDGVPAQLQMTECNLLGNIISDTIHPHRLGRALMAELLINYMLNAEYQLYFVKGAQSQLPDTRLPIYPLDPTGHMRWVFNCYGPGMAMTAGQDSSQVDGLHVVENNGWTFVEYQMHGEKKKYKPGYVATVPGSTLRLQLSTNFPRIKGNLQVGVGYLQSYEHMGKAWISCVEGCNCTTRIVDANVPNRKVSMTETLMLSDVTAADKCVIEIKVWNATSSGENKFKVVNLYSRAEVLPSITTVNATVNASAPKP